LAARLRSTLDDDDLLARVVRRSKKPLKAARRAVQIHADDRPGVVDKEVIHIPRAAPRHIPALERLLASLIMGRSSSIHGLTGKPLVYFTTIFVSLGVFLFGYDQGVMSGIITGHYFIEYFDQPSKATVGTMVAILEIGAFISSLTVGRVGDIIGRRKTILYGSCIFLVGGALQTCANSMPIMMLGRIIAGLGVGMLSTIVPVYQSEISPAHNRGKLACMEFSGNILGYTTSVWVDYFCRYIKSDISWRLPLLMQCVMGALLGIGSLIIVESPRWLLDNDHDEEGIIVIANLYGGGDIHDHKAREEFREIKMNVLLQRQEGERSYSDMFKRYRTRVLIAMSAQGLAQLNGINVISYYAPYVFESAGWKGDNAVLMTGINGITYLMSTIPPWYIVDRWGRRVILLSGALAMVVSLSLISYFIHVNIPATPTLVVIFVMVYNAAFGYSWGPIPWLYPPEILPLSIRSKGASLSTATNWAFNWLVGEMTPILQEWIQWRLYLLHAFFCAVSFVVGKHLSHTCWSRWQLAVPALGANPTILVYFLYPETCGVRLEDMNALFGDATTTMNTPAASGTPLLRPDADGRPGSPVPAMDIGGRAGHLSASSAMPGLMIDPPDIDDAHSKPRPSRSEGRQGARGVRGWLSSILRRGGPSNRDEGGAQYAPLEQDGD
jgi:sugar porter (SP) family MFS transporter